jgi:hypothetical protein
MAAPDLHQSFWVAIAAAAPVLGLASAVTADQSVRRIERAVERANRDRTGMPRIERAPFWVATSNIMLQAGLLGLALHCLSANYDSSRWRLIAAVAAVGGVFLVFLPTMWGALHGYGVAINLGPEAGAPDPPG